MKNGGSFQFATLNYQREHDFVILDDNGDFELWWVLKDTWQHEKKMGFDHQIET